jgi:hypothetical protein
MSSYVYGVLVKLAPGGETLLAAWRADWAWAAAGSPSPIHQASRPLTMRYVYPLDPECPVVAEFMETLFGDPTTMAMGAPVDDITEEFERRHRRQCKRCQEYGVRQRVTE